MTMLRLRSHSRGLGISPRRRPGKGAAPVSIVQDGLIAEWRFDDGAGQVVTDHSGNGFHAQLGPTAGVDPDEPVWSSTGLDMVLDGGSSGNNYVAIGSHLGMDDGSNRTVIVVASADLSNLGGASSGYGLFNWTNPSQVTLGDQWMLKVNANGKLSIETSFGQQFQHPSSLVDDGWHFFAAVQDGTRHGDVTLHLDDDTPYNESFWGSDFSNLTGATCFMGGLGYASGAFKDGRHSYCLVYGRALSPEELEQNRQALKAILSGRGITLP
jgi:hypothetical protein